MAAPPSPNALPLLQLTPAAPPQPEAPQRAESLVSPSPESVCAWCSGPIASAAGSFGFHGHVMHRGCCAYAQSHLDGAACNVCEQQMQELPAVSTVTAQCVLCLNDALNGTAPFYGCGHTFHSHCLIPLERQECPVCRCRVPYAMRAIWLRLLATLTARSDVRTAWAAFRTDAAAVVTDQARSMRIDSEDARLASSEPVLRDEPVVTRSWVS